VAQPNPQGQNSSKNQQAKHHTQPRGLAQPNPQGSSKFARILNASINTFVFLREKRYPETLLSQVAINY